jgi:FemAB-related protein (PEP-CTERM system-associated)
MRIREAGSKDLTAWDRWVDENPVATLFHRAGWRRVIQRATGHRPVYLLAEDEHGLQGVLPLFVISTWFFGRFAASMPFVNYGGVAAASEHAARALLERAASVGRQRGCGYVEFRHRRLQPGATELPTSLRKVTSILDLTPGTEDIWTGSLHQNVRNKIRKAGKKDVTIGSGPDHFDAFYDVFAIGQREHGTPVLPKRFFTEVVRAFGEQVNVYAAYREGRPIGGKLTIDHGDTRYFIWSASPRAANAFAPVPAMNWRAIEDAAAKGLRRIDFGRSTAGSSSEHFKKYWGVETEQLYWQYHLLARDEMPGLNPANPKFEQAIAIWRRLPLWVTRVVGPWLSRQLP